MIYWERNSFVLIKIEHLSYQFLAKIFVGFASAFSTILSVPPVFEVTKFSFPSKKKSDEGSRFSIVFVFSRDKRFQTFREAEEVCGTWLSLAFDNDQTRRLWPNEPPPKETFSRRIRAFVKGRVITALSSSVAKDQITIDLQNKICELKNYFLQNHLTFDM